MCDPIEVAPGTGWRGWTASALSRPAKAIGEWIDLTWPLSPGVPHLDSFPPPWIERIASIREDPLNVTELSMVVHVGTHVDSPRHFFSGWPALERVPLSRRMGSGVVWGMDKPLESLVEPEDLSRMGPELEPGDIVVLDTGIAEHPGTPEQIANARLPVGRRPEFVFLPLNIVGGDGAPARVLARAVEA